MGRIPTEEDELVIVVGSTEPMRVLLLDERGKPESLATADMAVLTVKEHAASEDAILHRSTEDSPDPTLAIHDSAGHDDPDEDPSYLEATLTGAESSDLVPGLYIGQIAVRFGDDDSWKASTEFIVRVKAPTAVFP